MQVAVAHKQACTARPISHRAAPYEEFFSRHYAVGAYGSVVRRHD